MNLSLITTIIFVVAYFSTITASKNEYDNFPIKILQQNPDDSVVFSPLSIYVAIGALYAGVKGQSKEQIKRAFFNNSTDADFITAIEKLKHLFNARGRGYNVTLANRVYIAEGQKLLESYNYTLTETFDTDILSTEFNDETVRDANEWVSSKTNEKIKNLLTPGSLDSLTRLLIINALHLKADWVEKFEAKSTISKNFYSKPEANNTVDMMQMYAQNFHYTSNDEVQVLGMPFVKNSEKGTGLIMFFVLPKERFGLKKFESSLNSYESLSSLFRASDEMQMAQVDIPKFKIQHKPDLKSALESVGIKDIFEESVADLSGISGDKNLFVKQAEHKAVIEVNESGVEAAAATFVSISMVSLPNTDFIADHPFLFAIVESMTYSPLFIGRFTGS